MGHKLRCFGILLASLLWAGAAVAQCAPSQMRTDLRPDAAFGPTEITASVIVNDILGVDDVNQQVELDLLVRLIWSDPRLQDLQGCRFEPADVWVPDVFLWNSANIRPNVGPDRAHVVIREDGTASFRIRLTGRVSSYHNLRNFPFDRHDFEFHFGPVNATEDEIVFLTDPEESWIAGRLNLEGWHVEAISIGAAPVLRETDNRTINAITLTISAEREVRYYLYRIMLPLCFVVAMSWFIFWVPPSRFEFQIGLGATSMLTVIAFKLALSGTLPQLGYLTALDKIMIWAIVLVFLSMTQALISGLLVLDDREADALRLDRVFRVVAPLALALGWFLIWRGAF